MQNKFRFHIIVKVMDAFWNGKISIGIEFYIIADTRCLCIVYILIFKCTNLPSIYNIELKLMYMDRFRAKA